MDRHSLRLSGESRRLDWLVTSPFLFRREGLRYGSSYIVASCTRETSMHGVKQTNLRSCYSQLEPSANK